MDYIKLKSVIRVTIVAWSLLLLWVPCLFSASLNFKASDQYVVKGDEVVFTFIYDPEGESPPDSLEIQLDYDKGILYNKEFTDLSGGRFEAKSPPVTFEQPGYFEANARFTITEGDNTVSRTIGPVEVNVANWKFSGIGCIGSTPVVSADGNTVYVGSEDGNLYAVDTQSGNENWWFDTNGQVDSSPALDTEGNIYFGSEDGRVYCVEPGAGPWQFPPAGQSGKGAFFSSPALDEERDQLYIGSNDGNVYALDMTDLSLEWSFGTGGKVVASPVIGHDGTIYAGSLDGYLYALNPDGTQKWRFDAAYKIRGAPALDADGTIFVGTCDLRGEVNENNGLHAVSPAGMEHWFAGKINGFPAAPVILKNGIVVIGSYDNTLYGVDRSEGSLSMYKRFSDDLLSSAAHASGYLFSGARDGIFYALNPYEGDRRQGRQEFWQYDLSMNLEGSSPVVQNGFVYVGACDYEAGALFSFVCNTDTENTDIGPEEEAPWPQARNKAANTGKTSFTADTIAPGIALTDPEPGTENFNVDRDSISVTFTMPMEPSSIYEAPSQDNDFEGYYGFTVEPFNAPDEDFTVTSNADNTKFTLTLPEGASFEKNTQYTASILSKAHAEGESDRSILYTYDWTFSQEEAESGGNSHDAWSCFINALFE